MALKPCKECGNKISASAKVCPHCGKGKTTQRYGCGSGCLLVIVVIILFYFIGKSTESPSPSKQDISPSKGSPSPAKTSIPVGDQKPKRGVQMVK